MPGHCPFAGLGKGTCSHLTLSSMHSWSFMLSLSLGQHAQSWLVKDPSLPGLLLFCWSGLNACHPPGAPLLHRLADDPVDVWVVRYNEEAPLWYWGFKQLPETEVARIASTSRGLLFLDGPDSSPAKAVQEVLYWYPQLPKEKLLQVCTAVHL